MKTHLMKFFDISLNILSLLVVVLVLGIIGQRYLYSSPGPVEQTGNFRRGDRLSLPAVDWSPNQSNLVMALSIGCHYFQQSAGFYRALLEANSTNSFRPIAVFPQPAPEAQAYLHSQGVNVDEVWQADFSSLRIAGTPTLVLVDSTGRVKSSWFGKLSPKQEDDVFRELNVHPKAETLKYRSQAEQGSAPNDELEYQFVSPAQLRTLLRTERAAPIVDIRSRDNFHKAHIFDAMSIPLAELPVRAAHEIPKDSTVIIYCHFKSTCEASAHAQGVPTFCSAGAALLREMGFGRVKLLEDNLSQLKSDGISVIGDVTEIAPVTARIGQ